MNLPDTFRPETIDTATGTSPRTPWATPGGLSFFCPCCPVHLARPMVRDPEPGERGLVVFRCHDCPTVLLARRVPGIRK